MFKERFLQKKFYFIYAVLVLVLFLTLFKIHGSSVGMYNQLLKGGVGSDYQDPDLLFSQPRSIRSDEWVVQTPLTLSQAANHFKTFNPNVGDGQTVAAFLDIPVAHWTILFKPANWSYFFLPIEYAFAFKWWIRAAFLLISAYVVFYTLFKGNIFIASTGSLILFFSPFVQWWYSVSVIESLSFGLFIIYFFIRLYNANGKKQLWLNALWFSYFFTAFTFILYPPFQISVGLFVLFFCLGYTWQYRKTHSKKTFFHVGLAITFSVILAGILTGIYYLNFKGTIDLIRHTVYPGERQIISGIFSTDNFLSGFYNIFLLDDKRGVTPTLGNQSEASSFFLLSLFLLPTIIIGFLKGRFKKTGIHFLMLGIIGYILLTLAWFYLHPEVLITNHLISPNSFWGSLVFLLGTILNFFYHLFMLHLVPFNRMVIGLGLANLFLILYFLFESEQKSKISLTHIIMGIVIFAVHWMIGLSFMNQNPHFIQNTFEIFEISALALFLLIILLLRRRYLFMVVLLIFSVFTSASVNPLYRGLAPILDSKLTHMLQETNADSFIVYNYHYAYGHMNNFILGSGVKSLDATQIYPQFALWKKLDPSGEFTNAYNRYANVLVSDDPKTQRFFSPQADMLKVSISPCDPSLPKTDKTYFLFFDEAVDYPCLTFEKGIRYPNAIILFYRYTGT